MNLSTLGKRYERLLFLSAMLSVICITTMLIAVALTTQQERFLANCMRIANNTVTQNEELLSKKWNEYQTPSKKNVLAKSDYEYALIHIWIRPGINSHCYEEIKEFFKANGNISPKALIEKLFLESKKLENSTLKIKAVEIPNIAKITLLGSDINITIEALINIIQIAIAPILLLWLGSLYNTRYRETKLISKASNITNIYPHLINIYAVGNTYKLAPRKWSKLLYIFPQNVQIGFMYSLVRSFLVIFIVIPAVTTYLYSLFILPINDNYLISFIIGLWIAITTLVVILTEYATWHVYKIFHMPSE